MFAFMFFCTDNRNFISINKGETKTTKDLAHEHLECLSSISQAKSHAKNPYRPDDIMVTVFGVLLQGCYRDRASRKSS